MTRSHCFFSPALCIQLSPQATTLSLRLQLCVVSYFKISSHTRTQLCSTHLQRSVPSKFIFHILLQGYMKPWQDSDFYVDCFRIILLEPSQIFFFTKVYAARCSKLIWTYSVLPGSKWTCLGSRVLLHDPQRTLPSLEILWFCDSWDKFDWCTTWVKFHIAKLV